MATGATRDDGTLRGGLQRWVAHAYPERRGITVDRLARPAAGWSSETVIVRMSWPAGAVRHEESFVVRLPLLVPSYPGYDLRVQEAVLRVLAGSEVPAPRVIARVDDEQWLGAPFLAMTFVEGRPVGEVPALDPWLCDAPAARQQRVHEGFLAALASLHRVDARATSLGAVVRCGLGAEIDYWTGYIHWAAAPDAPARALVAAVEWCAATAPPDDPERASLLWGDARLGNVMYDDGGDVVALLDWELASIGPAEMDLAWYLGLDELTRSFVGRTLPGFLGRGDAIRYYEGILGRPVRQLAWHEVFALVRSIAINDRQARLAAVAGTPYPGVPGDANPILTFLDRKIAAVTD